jgi:transposase
MEKRRMKAIRLFEKKIVPAEVARRLGVHRQSATRWRKEWLAGGREALESRGKLGRKRELTAEQEAELAVILEAGAVASGLSTELWTLPRVAKLVRERFGVDYHPGHVGKVLAAMGFSCQRPTRRAIERDEEKIRHWKRHHWPALKKKPVEKGV